MSIQQNEMFQSSLKNLAAAIDKIKFNASMTAEECETIRSHIGNAKGELSILSGIEPDHDGKLLTLTKLADFMDNAMNALDDSDRYL